MPESDPIGLEGGVNSYAYVGDIYWKCPDRCGLLRQQNGYPLSSVQSDDLDKLNSLSCTQELAEMLEIQVTAEIAFVIGDPSEILSAKDGSPVAHSAKTVNTYRIKAHGPLISESLTRTIMSVRPYKPSDAGHPRITMRSFECTSSSCTLASNVRKCGGFRAVSDDTVTVQHTYSFSLMIPNQRPVRLDPISVHCSWPNGLRAIHPSRTKFQMGSPITKAISARYLNLKAVVRNS